LKLKFIQFLKSKNEKIKNAGAVNILKYSQKRVEIVKDK
jgi:hypothetical protein